MSEIVAIGRFRGEFEFLSNFSGHAIIDKRNRVWLTAEHAFQGQKTEDRVQQERIRNSLTPADAKRRGRTVTLRPDWEQIKDDVMRRVVLAKFEQHPDLAAMLMATGDRILVEGNTWHDTYWGVCICAAHGSTGANVLGTILMEVREKLRHPEDFS